MTHGHTLMEIVAMIEPEQRRWLSAIHIVDGVATLRFAAGSPDRGRIAQPDDDWTITGAEPIERQAAMLQGTQYLGNIDIAGFDAAGRGREWIIKTHAGSREERTAWLMSLQRL